MPNYATSARGNEWSCDLVLDSLRFSTDTPAGSMYEAQNAVAHRALYTLLVEETVPAELVEPASEGLNLIMKRDPPEEPQFGPTMALPAPLGTLSGSIQAERQNRRRAARETARETARRAVRETVGYADLLQPEPQETVMTVGTEALPMPPPERRAGRAAGRRSVSPPPSPNKRQRLPNRRGNAPNNRNPGVSESQNSGHSRNPSHSRTSSFSRNPLLSRNPSLSRGPSHSRAPSFARNPPRARNSFHSRSYSQPLAGSDVNFIPLLRSRLAPLQERPGEQEKPGEEVIDDSLATLKKLETELTALPRDAPYGIILNSEFVLGATDLYCLTHNLLPSHFPFICSLISLLTSQSFFQGICSVLNCNVPDIGIRLETEGRWSIRAWCDMTHPHLSRASPILLRGDITASDPQKLTVQAYGSKKLILYLMKMMGEDVLKEEAGEEPAQQPARSDRLKKHRFFGSPRFVRDFPKIAGLEQKILADLGRTPIRTLFPNRPTGGASTASESGTAPE